MNNVPLIFGSRRQGPAYLGLRMGCGGQLEALSNPVSLAAGWSDLHFKGPKPQQKKHIGERLLLIPNDSKGSGHR